VTEEVTCQSPDTNANVEGINDVLPEGIDYDLIGEDIEDHCDDFTETPETHQSE
jgi:hypothetical protein